MPAPRAQHRRRRWETALGRLSPWLLQVLGIYLTEMKGTTVVPFSLVFAFLVSGVSSGLMALFHMPLLSSPALPWHCEVCYLDTVGWRLGSAKQPALGEPR